MARVSETIRESSSLNDNLISPSQSATERPTLNESLLSPVKAGLRYLGFGTHAAQPPIQQALINQDNHNSGSVRGDSHGAPLDEVDMEGNRSAQSTPLPTETAIKRGRGRPKKVVVQALPPLPKKRKDVDDVHSSDDAAETMDKQHTPSPAKKRKPSARKEPIVQPVTSLSRQNKQKFTNETPSAKKTRSINGLGGLNKGPGSEGAVIPQPSQSNSGLLEEQPSPCYNEEMVPEAEPEKTSGSEYDAETDPNILPENVPEHDLEVNLKESLDDNDSEEGDISSILESPSPRKPASPLKRARKLAPSKQAREQRSRSPTSETEEPGVQSNGHSEPEEGGQFTAELAYIKEMITIADKVGQSLSESRLTRADFAGITTSADGKKLNGLLNKLSDGFKGLRKAAQDGQRLDKMYDGLSNDLEDTREAIEDAKTAAQDGVTKIFKAVKKLALQIHNNELSGSREFTLQLKREEKKERRRLLLDLYYHVIPSFLSVIQLAISVRDNEDLTTTEALQELVDLLGLAYNLSNAALKQPQTFQPTIANGIKSCRIRFPIHQIKPMISKLNSKFSDIIWTRVQAIEAEEAERKADEARRETTRIQKARRQEIERQHSIAAKQWNSLMMDPELGPAIKKGVMKVVNRSRDPTLSVRGSREAYSSNREMDLQQPAKPEGGDDDDHNNAEYDDDSDPFADEPVQRVQVFGSDNKRGKVRTWTKEEKGLFVDIMMQEELGHDRYQRAADALKADLPDIHDLAKDFQEAMDECHAKGTMNTQYDDWTYNIWVNERE